MKTTKHYAGKKWRALVSSAMVIAGISQSVIGGSLPSDVVGAAAGYGTATGTAVGTSQYATPDDSFQEETYLSTNHIAWVEEFLGSLASETTIQQMADLAAADGPGLTESQLTSLSSTDLNTLNQTTTGTGSIFLPGVDDLDIRINPAVLYPKNTPSLASTQVAPKATYNKWQTQIDQACGIINNFINGYYTKLDHSPIGPVASRFNYSPEDLNPGHNPKLHITDALVTDYLTILVHTVVSYEAVANKKIKSNADKAQIAQANVVFQARGLKYWQFEEYGSRAHDFLNVKFCNASQVLLNNADASAGALVSHFWEINNYLYYTPNYGADINTILNDGLRIFNQNGATFNDIKNQIDITTLNFLAARGYKQWSTGIGLSPYPSDREAALRDDTLKYRITHGQAWAWLINAQNHSGKSFTDAYGAPTWNGFLAVVGQETGSIIDNLHTQAWDVRNAIETINNRTQTMNFFNNIENVVTIFAVGMGGLGGGLKSFVSLTDNMAKSTFDLAKFDKAIGDVVSTVAVAGVAGNLGLTYWSDEVTKLTGDNGKLCPWTIPQWSGGFLDNRLGYTVNHYRYSLKSVLGWYRDAQNALNYCIASKIQETKDLELFSVKAENFYNQNSSNPLGLIFAYFDYKGNWLYTTPWVQYPYSQYNPGAVIDTVVWNAPGTFDQGYTAQFDFGYDDVMFGAVRELGSVRPQVFQGPQNNPYQTKVSRY